jgi:hypothetical protein
MSGVLFWAALHLAAVLVVGVPIAIAWGRT